MRLIINIKKIIINPNYEKKKYMQIQYKDYNHGRRFWCSDKSFMIWFKNVYHGYGLWQWDYTHYKMFHYKNNTIYSEYIKCIILNGKHYELKN